MRITLWLGAIGYFLAIGPFCVPAHAQATRTWVSGVGDDVNPCSRTAPCKTFAGAISKTAAGGEINCLDPGGFGAVTITKSITIDCANTEAGVVVAGTNGIIVSAAAADVVVLRGLDIIGTAATPSLNGIVFNTGAALHVEKSSIREFLQTGSAGFGVLFQPTTASKLYVSDTILTHNGSGSGGGAITIRPSGSGSASVTIIRTTATNNVSGFTADTGTGPTSGQVFMVARDSVSSGNTSTAFSAVSSPSSGNVGIFVDHSLSGLSTIGLSASGTRALIQVGNSSVWGNGTGVIQSNGGQVVSFGNNTVANSVNGAFTPPIIQPQ